MHLLSETAMEHWDMIGAISSIVGAFICPYISQVILRERAPLVQWQRLTLIILAAALLANGVLYPDWPYFIEYRRPTGVVVDVMVMINLLVMAIRGHVIYQRGRPRHTA